MHIWSVNCKHQTAASSFWLEVRSLKTFSFLDRHQISPEKINIHATILNYTKDGGPSFHTQDVAKRLVIKKILHFTYIYRKYMRTFKQEGKKH